MKGFFAVCALVILCVPHVLFAEEVEYRTETLLAEVVKVVSEETRFVPGTETKASFQTLSAKLLEGSERGRLITVTNDYLSLEEGEKFYTLHTVDPLLGVDSFSVSEPYRLDGLFVLIGLFIACVFVLGGAQGIRGLAALAISFLAIGYLLLPGILSGVSPLFVALGVASAITVLGSYITHGFNRVTTSSVIGMLSTLALTAFLAEITVSATRLSGFSSDEAVYLNLNTQGSIDFAGLLLGAILIGLLGVLYDAAIGQAAAVDEIAKAAPEATRREVFSRAMRIGREHIGALVNTLAIAYVGAALPLLLLFYNLNSDVSILTTLNREIFATEIVRMTVSSIGIMLAVPISTGVAVLRLVRRRRTTS